jgi:hypothetical protein
MNSDCALGSRTRWSPSVTVVKRNQSAEDLICHHYCGGDLEFFECRDYWRDIARHPPSALMSCRKRSREMEIVHEARGGV